MSYLDALEQFWNTAATAGTWDSLVFGIQIGGWIILFPLLFWMVFSMFVIMQIGKTLGSFEWVYLAIDVPRDNILSPLAVENIFAHLAGAHGTLDLEERYWHGQYQRWFSFEIVSIEGYIQFIIRTEKKFRDLVESAVYAQYPEAQITEIDDYTTDIPSEYPNDTHECWGAEWKQTASHFYPIRTYPMFEDKSAKDDVFKDPMAALLESFSRIGKGEQMWFQILVKPIGQKWKLGGFELAKTLMGNPPKPKITLLSKLGDIPFKILQTIGFALGTTWFAEGDEKDEKIDWGVFRLTPGERTSIEAIERKVSKIGYNVKIRAVYVAEKERYDKNRVAYGLVGAIKQFSDESSNSLKPDYRVTGTTGHYVFIEARKNLRRNAIMRNYKARTTWGGLPEFILNIEELATLWHFPVMSVKTPLLARTAARRVMPPSELPSEIPFEEAPHGIPLMRARVAGAVAGISEPPPALPIETRWPGTGGLSNDEGEEALGEPPQNLPTA